MSPISHTKRVRAKILQASASEFYGEPAVAPESGLRRTIDYFRGEQG